MKAKTCKIVENSHTYCTTCMHISLKKRKKLNTVNNIGLAR